MSTQSSGEVWESDDERLHLRRTIERAGDDQYLVQVEFSNATADELSALVIEDLPENVGSATAITTPGGDPAAWRRVGAWVVHEPLVPGTSERSSAYLIESTDGSKPSLAPPRVRRVERKGDSTATDGDDRRDRPRTEGSETTPDGHEGDLAGDGPQALPVSTERPLPQDQSAEILEELLTALEAADGDDRKRALRSELGLAPSERARVDYLKSRLDDLSAYVDALEQLVDEHGIDVIGDLRDATAENARRTEALSGDVDRLEDTVEAHRADADREIAALDGAIEDLRAAVADLEERFDRHATDVDDEMDRVDGELVALRTRQREQRQVRARETRRLEQRLDDLQSTVSDLEDDVTDIEEFRDRFRSAFRREPSTDDKQPAVGPAGPGTGDE